MDKRRPTYNLATIKISASTQTIFITTKALASAAAIGFDRGKILEAISGIEAKQFYKSVTSFSNHKLWHDVYHVPVGNMVIYIKLLERDGDVWLMSFKEK